MLSRTVCSSSARSTRTPYRPRRSSTPTCGSPAPGWSNSDTVLYMNAVRTFRVIVRGEFTGLTDDQRHRLLAEADRHDLLRATYSETGDLSYDETLRPFTVRCQVVQPADRPDQAAVDHGLLTASALLEELGLAY